jgi:phosphatidylglycerophosphate synthase
LFNPLLIVALFFMPEEPHNLILATTYIISIFVSVAVSGFFMTYIRESEYNIFRNAKTFNQVMITIMAYIFVLLGVSYLLAVTEWFLFLFW